MDYQQSILYRLSGQGEIPPEPFKIFYGDLSKQMLLLMGGKDEEGRVVDVPRIQASTADIIGRRMEAPNDVISNWRGYQFFTGDGAVSNSDGDYLVVLEDLLPPELQFLRNCYLEGAPASKKYGGGIVLPDGAWDELKSQKDKVVHLTAEEVQEAFGNGYVHKDDVWIPANKAVGKVWDALSRGKDIMSYLQLVGENCTGNDRLNSSDRILNVIFPLPVKELQFIAPLTKDGKPLIRSWVIEGIYSISTANCWSYAFGSAFTVGLVPEAREKALEARVLSALEHGKEFEFNGRIFRPVDSPKSE